MKKIAMVTGLVVILALGGVLLAATAPVIDDSNASHKGYESMAREHCLKCHKMGLGEAPQAPGHCIPESDCISCHG